jgi:hypothetical protein
MADSGKIDAFRLVHREAKGGHSRQSHTIHTRIDRIYTQAYDSIWRWQKIGSPPYLFTGAAHSDHLPVVKARASNMVPDGAGRGRRGGPAGPVEAARPVPCGLESRDPSQGRLGARVRLVSERAMSFNVQVGSGQLKQAWPFPHTRKKSTRICCPVGVGSTGCVA